MVTISLISSLLIRLVIKTIIVLFYAHPRPYLILHLVKPLIAISPGENFQSFPSGHALFFFALATTLYLFNKKLGILYFIAAIIMGLARIYVGVHWPDDILVGAIIGILMGLATYLIYLKYQPKFDYIIKRIFAKIDKNKCQE